MSKIYFLLLSTACLLSCSMPKNPETEPSQKSKENNITQDSVAIVNDPINNLNVKINGFTEIDSSGILMFPLGMGESKRGNDYLSYKNMPNGANWNIAFYNSKTAAYHLLSEKKMLIQSFENKYLNTNENRNESKKYIFYNIITDDTNGDKFFSNEDASYLFISDKTGKNLKQISPANYDLQSWSFINSSNKIIMVLKKDSDKNKIFDEKDEVTTFVYDVEKGTEPTEVFPTDFKNKLKVLYDRDWKRVKK